MAWRENSLVHAFNAVHVDKLWFLTDLPVLVESFMLTHWPRLLGSSIPAVNLVSGHGNRVATAWAREKGARGSGKAKELVRPVRWWMTVHMVAGREEKVTGAKSEVGHKLGELLGEKDMSVSARGFGNSPLDLIC